MGVEFRWWKILSTAVFAFAFPLQFCEFSQILLSQTANSASLLFRIGLFVVSLIFIWHDVFKFWREVIEWAGCPIRLGPSL